MTILKILVFIIILYRKMQQQQQQKLTETEELSVPNNTEISQITEKGAKT
jgi:hypothetical protein